MPDKKRKPPAAAAPAKCQVSLYMPDELYQAVQITAVEEDRTVAATIREAIRQYTERPR